MKKVLSMLAVVTMLTSVASAELLKNFKYDGTVEINAYSLNNKDFNKDSDDSENLTKTRVILNMGFDLNEDASAVVTAVKKNRDWDGNTQESAITGALDSFTFYQAYINLKGIMGLDHKLGKQFYGNPGDLVIYFGPKYWPYNGFDVDSIDAWVGSYKYNNFDFTAILGKEKLGGGLNNDIDLKGIDVKTKVKDYNLNAYYYEEVDRTAANKPSYLGLFGLRANGEIKGFKLAAEYNMNIGKYDSVAIGRNWIDYKGYAYKINAGYDLDLMGKLSLCGEYLFSTGDDAGTTSKDESYISINGDWRPTIINYGYGSSHNVGDGNVIYGITAKWTPEKLNKLNLEAKYYDFSADEKGVLADKHEASEFNLVATWNHSDNVSVKGYYAALTPEKKNNANDDAMTVLGAAFVVKF